MCRFLSVLSAVSVGRKEAVECDIFSVCADVLMNVLVQDISSLKWAGLWECAWLL